MRPGLHRLAFASLFDLLEVCHCPVRLELLLALLERPTDVGALAAQLGVAYSTASNHLRALDGAGLVRSARAGRYRVYRLAPTAAGRSAEGGVHLSLRADDGSGVTLQIPPAVAAQLRKGGGSAPGEPGVGVRPAAFHLPALGVVRGPGPARSERAEARGRGHLRA